VSESESVCVIGGQVSTMGMPCTLQSQAHWC
jgi:hypothetical protein